MERKRGEKDRKKEKIIIIEKEVEGEKGEEKRREKKVVYYLWRRRLWYRGNSFVGAFLCSAERESTGRGACRRKKNAKNNKFILE